jgi:uncharacterized membrane protein
MSLKRTARLTSLSFTLLLSICIVNRGLAQRPSFTTVDVPGASYTEAFGINLEGDIVGYYKAASPSGSITAHGFLLSNGAFRSIDVPGASFTWALGINPQGEIVGAYGNSTGAHGFLLRRGVFTTLDVPGDIPFPGSNVSVYGTSARGINQQGQIVGNYLTQIPGFGFLLSRGAFTNIDVSRASYTSANGINSQGDIVGHYTFGAPPLYGFLLSKGVFSNIIVPGAFSTFAFGVNQEGDIVGYYGGIAGQPGVDNANHGFLLRKGAFTTIDVPGATDTSAYGINQQGDIVGSYVNAAVTHGFLLRKITRASGEGGEAGGARR